MTEPKSTMGMLKEIESGTAAEAGLPPPPVLQVTELTRQVVLEARSLNHPFGPTFLPQLDGCLASARPHAGESKLERGDLIEIAGPSGSGKTTISIFLLMTSLLPSTWVVNYPNPTLLQIGGRNQYAALVYPTTHSSPIPLLQKRMDGHIRNSIITQMGQIAFKPELERQIDSLIKEALGRLRVIRVRPRWRSWSLALKTLLGPPVRRHREERGNEGEGTEGGMDLIVCDGFGDGFWPERWHDEQKRGQGQASQHGKRIIGLRGGDDVGLHDLMEDVNRLRREMGSVIVLSIQGLYRPGPFYTTHLPPPFPNPFGRDRDRDQTTPPSDTSMHPLNIQISLHGRIRPLQEPPDRTLYEALSHMLNTRESESRKFEGVVRVIDAQGSGGEVGGMRFGWTKGPFGVHVWED